MAWRPTHLVVGGELDNTRRGRVTGWLQLEGREQPLQLALEGNCHPDLAGWRFQIVRLEPVPGWEEKTAVPEFIATEQSGKVGDITADMTIRHFDCPFEEFLTRRKLGEPVPEELRKCLYLEWYSSSNGRVVIQCTRLGVKRLGGQAFELSEKEFHEGLGHNEQAHHQWLQDLGAAVAELDDSDPDDLQSQLDQQAEEIDEAIRRSLEE